MAKDRVMHYHYKKAMECLNEGLQTMEREQAQGEDRFLEITQIRRAISMLHNVIGELNDQTKAQGKTQNKTQNTK
jgi:hypothetical protein